MTVPRPIIIDTDPGQDDAVAIWLALAAPDALEVRAITIASGNVPLPLTQRNARAIVEAAGRNDIPVHAGCDRPWVRLPCTAEHVHGRSGLDGAALPEPRLPLADGHAVDALIGILSAAPEHSITLCPIGPLTNIATALVRAPTVVTKIREIVLMGGAIGVGNITPSAEFNIYADPHAAAAVFGAGAPITMIPLEATHQVLATPAWAQTMAALGTRVGAAIAGMVNGSSRRDLTRFGGRGVPVHDACVIAYLLWPELFAGVRCHVAIETAGEFTLGRTVVDRWGRTDNPANALVVEQVDAAALFARMTERLRTLP